MVYEYWVIHKKPEDYPCGFVARKWVAQARQPDVVTEETIVCPNLFMIHQVLQARKLKRWERDDTWVDTSPRIIEVWVPIEFDIHQPIEVEEISF